MVKCCRDTSTHTILLSQYLDNPGEHHYHALWAVAHNLVATVTVGIHHWWQAPVLSLKEPSTHADNHDLTKRRGTNSTYPIGFVDSDWATNIKKRASLTGAIVMLAGGAIGYKSKFQTVIAHSSTEAEFLAACDTTKMILFFHSKLDELGLSQENATILFEDNTGALMMANAQQPTKHTRHIDIKNFAL